MIFNASVIDGFKVVLGSLPLQLGMLLTILFMIPIPELNGENDKEAQLTYIWLVFVHTILFAQIVINHYFAHLFPTLSSLSNVLLMMVQVITQINLCVNWVFYAHPDAEWEAARSDEDWTKFKNWIQIEVLIFVGYLVSAILFNMLRSFREMHTDIENPATNGNCFADVLEAAMIITGIINSFASPLFVTSVLIFSGD